MELKALKEERAALSKKAQAFKAETDVKFDSDGPDADSVEKLEAYNADLAELDLKVRAAEASARISVNYEDEPERYEESRADGPPVNFDEEDALSAFAGFVLGEDATPRMRSDMQRAGLNANASKLRLDLSRRVPTRFDGQVVGTAGKGGVTVPEAVLGPLERALVEQSEIRRFCSVHRAPRGGKWPLAHVENNIAPASRAETEAVTFSTVDMDKVVIEDSGVSAGVKCSIELLQDSIYNMQSTLDDLLREAMAKEIAARYGMGVAGTNFNGLFPSVTASGVTVDFGGPTYKQLVDIQQAVNRSSRRGPNAVWIVSDEAVKYLRYLVDLNGNPQWQDGLREGEPDRLLGRPVVVETTAPDWAEGETPILYGDARKFHVKDVAQVSVQVMRELYAENGQIGLIAHYRGGSLLHDLDGDSLLSAAVGTEPAP